MFRPFDSLPPQAQWTKMGGQADIIHFLNFEYFKNYAKHEKSENIFIFKNFFFKFSKKKIEKIWKKKISIFFWKKI